MPVAPAAMPAVAPARFFRREAIDLLARGDGGLRIGIDGLSRAEAERALCVAIYYAVLFADQELVSWEIM